MKRHDTYREGFKITFNKEPTDVELIAFIEILVKKNNKKYPEWIIDEDKSYIVWGELWGYNPNKRIIEYLEQVNNRENELGRKLTELEHKQIAIKIVENESI